MNLICSSCNKETPGTGLFCPHCGAKSSEADLFWLEIRPEPGAALITVPLDASPFILGRGSSASYSFESTRVSRRHAELTRSGLGWQIRDLGSTNGTQVRGQQIQSGTYQPLLPGDVIDLGSQGKATFCASTTSQQSIGLTPVAISPDASDFKENFEARMAAPALNHQSLADAGERLIAKVIDYVSLIALMFASAFIVGLVNPDISDDGLNAAVIIMILFWFSLQGYLTAVYSQSIGKRLLGLQIVLYETQDNHLPSENLGRKFFLRGVFGELVLGLLPFYGLVDALSISREDRRCIHDLIAGTQVIRIKRS